MEMSSHAIKRSQQRGIPRNEKEDQKMVIFINRKGKGFIFFELLEKRRALLVTPWNLIKPLGVDKFVKRAEGNACDFLSSGLVTEKQVETYKEKILSMEAEAQEREERKAQEAWEGMTGKQLEIVLSTAWKKLSPSKQEEVNLILGNFGVEL
jgi:hypothetical protein